MKDFESLKEIWQQAPEASSAVPNFAKLTEKAIDSKSKLLKAQVRGIITMITTGLFISWLSFFSKIKFQQTLTYIAVSMMIAIVLIQAVLNYFTYKKIKAIDEIQDPATYLGQWESYFQFRKKQLGLNLPIYYIFLNLSFGLYFIEILSGRPIVGIVIFMTIYIAWMLFAYFYLGKRSIAKEEKRIMEIINGLRQIVKQF